MVEGSSMFLQVIIAEFSSNLEAQDHLNMTLGVGQVSFSALGSGFRFLDFAQVGFRVKLGSNFFAFFSQFWLYLATN